MIISFGSKGTKDIFDGKVGSKAARKIPVDIHSVAHRKLDMLYAAVGLKDLRSPPNNRLEKLKGDYSGMYSIRINDQWRIIFNWENGNCSEVKIIDYHS